MEGTISNYVRGRHNQKTNQAIVVVKDYDSKDKAQSLVGKKVTWVTPGNKEIKGEVRSSHGNKGAVRVLFETGIPGQALGKKVKIE